MGLTVEVRVGRKRAIVIPKAIAEALGIDEGSKLKLTVENGKIILEPIPDAIQLSLRGDKLGKVSLEDLEAGSIEIQKRYIN
ncbi:MAG: AbrB family transcriptional regulator [Desulfurococcales archaeon ex4484_42]|nr:MAG: AbrB family transcriptional regulator [Desulfurococcales archaeon ex4484_42]